MEAIIQTSNQETNGFIIKTKSLMSLCSINNIYRTALKIARYLTEKAKSHPLVSESLVWLIVVINLFEALLLL